MATTRKDYTPLPDSTLDKLKADASLMSASLMSYANSDLTLPAKTIHALVAEVIDAREEIFRLQLCETVDAILSEELGDDDDAEDLLAFHWPGDTAPEDDIISGAYRSASSEKVTDRLPKVEFPPPPFGLDPDDASRRLPRQN